MNPEIFARASDRTGGFSFRLTDWPNLSGMHSATTLHRWATKIILSSPDIGIGG